MNRRYDAVLFDLLTALLDSWSLWNTVAGDADSGHRWRMAYLRITYAAGHYRPYEQLVGDAAQAVGLPGSLAENWQRATTRSSPGRRSAPCWAHCTRPALRSAW
jgi:hypothetical protein